jgi:ADP-ribosylglycohydrolase
MPAVTDSFRDRLHGTLVGAALGDALGMPLEGLSHQNVRTYYRGIKGLRADEKRGDLAAGQGTADTQRMRALARALATAPPDAPEEVREAFAAELDALGVLRREEVGPSPSAACAACAAPFGIQARLRGLGDLAVARWVGLLLGRIDANPVAHVAGAAHVAALRACLVTDAAEMSGPALYAAALSAAQDAERLLATDARVSTRLRALLPFLDEVPLDLQDRCNGTGSAADEAVPFALAMVARGPDLPEATLLSAVNVGGDAAAVGAIVGALLGAINGASAFPAEWLDGLEDAEAIRAEADALAAAFGL